MSQWTCIVEMLPTNSEARWLPNVNDVLCKSGAIKTGSRVRGRNSALNVGNWEIIVGLKIAQLFFSVIHTVHCVHILGILVENLFNAEDFFIRLS